LDDLDELAGYVAAEANHAKVKKLEKELRRLYSRIAEVLESYTDEPRGSTTMKRINESTVRPFRI
jgi:plasmid stabilization system protein ParE